MMSMPSARRSPSVATRISRACAYRNCPLETLTPSALHFSAASPPGFLRRHFRPTLCRLRERGALDETRVLDHLGLLRHPLRQRILRIHRRQVMLNGGHLAWSRLDHRRLRPDPAPNVLLRVDYVNRIQLWREAVERRIGHQRENQTDRRDHRDSPDDPLPRSGRVVMLEVDQDAIAQLAGARDVWIG